MAKQDEEVVAGREYAYRGKTIQIGKQYTFEGGTWKVTDGYKMWCGTVELTIKTVKDDGTLGRARYIYLRDFAPTAVQAEVAVPA